MISRLELFDFGGAPPLGKESSLLATPADPTQLRRLLALVSACLIAGCQSQPPQSSDDDRLLTSVIERGVGCEQCSVQLEYLGRLGSSADTLLMTTETMIAARTDGAFIVAPLSRDGEAAIYDSLGAVGRPYGRAGDGPGENGRILHVLPWRGDSVLFTGFDRLTFLSGERGEGRTSRLERPSPSHRTVVLLEDDAIVRNYSYPPDRQFVAFNQDGTLRAEMGLGWEVGSRRDVSAVLAEMGPARSPHLFWSAPQRYRIQVDLWDAHDGALVRRFEDSAPWYSPYDSAALSAFLLAGNDAENPPPPFLRGIRETSDSVLLLLFNIPARNWAPVRDSLPPLQRRLRREAYDAVLNIRDPLSGESLLTIWVNLPFARLINDTLLADRRQTEDGFWVYDIYRMMLQW